MKHAMLFWLSMLAAACGQEKAAGGPPHPIQTVVAKTAQPLSASTTPPPNPPGSNATTYQEIRGGAVVDAPPISLCELLKVHTAGAGAYRVKSITGYTEELLDLPGNFDGFTYVELDLVADWSGVSPANPIVRISGGPKTADITKLWTIGLKVGEVVGLLIWPANPGNRGFPGIAPRALFREKPDGGYSNGELFTKQPVALDAIGHTVQNLVNLGPACESQDVLPDLDGARPGAAPPAGPPPVPTPAGPTSPVDGGTR